MDQHDPRLPEQRRPVSDSDLEAMRAAGGRPDQTDSRSGRTGRRGLTGGPSEHSAQTSDRHPGRRWRYTDALQAARRLSSGGGRPAESSG